MFLFIFCVWKFVGKNSKYSDFLLPLGQKNDVYLNIN